jgi:hypothetical protein
VIARAWAGVGPVLTRFVILAGSPCPVTMT